MEAAAKAKARMQTWRASVLESDPPHVPVPTVTLYPRTGPNPLPLRSRRLQGPPLSNKPHLPPHSDTPIVLCSYGRRSKHGVTDSFFDAYTDCEINRASHGGGDRGRTGEKIVAIDDPRSYKCCGRNGHIMLAIATNPEFLGIMTNVMIALKQLQIPLWHQYHHGMRCASGHHRAVASTELVASCLIADGWNVKIEHWDLGDNYPACGCPDACTRRNPPELLDEWHRDGNAALVVAYRLWRSIAPP